MRAEAVRESVEYVEMRDSPGRAPQTDGAYNEDLDKVQPRPAPPLDLSLLRLTALAAGVDARELRRRRRGRRHEQHHGLDAGLDERGMDEGGGGCRIFIFADHGARVRAWILFPSRHCFFFGVRSGAVYSDSFLACCSVST